MFIHIIHLKKYLEKLLGAPSQAEATGYRKEGHKVPEQPPSDTLAHFVAAFAVSPYVYA